jgi:hypothetical protein
MSIAAFRVSIVALGLGLGLASTAGALPKVFKCEKTVTVELQQTAVRKGKCFSKCYKTQQTGDGKCVPGTPNSCSCVPPFDDTTGKCANTASKKYRARVVEKCTGSMPTCGDYAQGFCSNDLSQTCSSSLQCFQGFCGGKCSVTTTSPCRDSHDCLQNETCTFGAAKDPLVLAFDRLNLGVIGTNGWDDLGPSFFCIPRRCSSAGTPCTGPAGCSAEETCDLDDPNPKARILCETAAYEGMQTQFMRHAICEDNCFERKQVQGQAIKCNQFDPALDQGTKACLAQSVQTFIAGVGNKCPAGLPKCGFYGLGTVATMANITPGAFGNLYEEDNPDVIPFNPYCAP